MTLVAALSNFGTPAVIGDLLITTPADPTAPSFLPTSQEATRLPSSRQFRIAGARKKVHIINPKFAVVWTGSMFAASVLLRELYGFATTQPFTIASLESFLARHAEFVGELAVHLIG